MIKNRHSSGFLESFLISATGSGILDGFKFSVKDVFDIKNQLTNFGNPLWGKTHPLAVKNATCIDQLLANGANCIGRTIAGELGCGSAGINHFYEMPINPKAPDLVPGGSSSGSAVSVANGLVNFSLGTDSGGSVRVPASFCGVFGMRPSQGIISMSGVTTLTPSLDTVGVFSESIDTLSKVMSVLLGIELKNNNQLGEIYIIDDFVQICSSDVKLAMKEFTHTCQREFNKTPIVIKLADFDEIADDQKIGIANTFLYILCGEMWSSINVWANEVKLEYGRNTYVDFSFMQKIDEAKIADAFLRKKYYMDKLNNFLLNNNLFCIPTTPFFAIKRPNEKTKVNEFDYDKLRPLVSLSSIGNLPQINLPILNNGKPPIGISLISAFKKDAFLLDVSSQLIRSG